MSRRTGERAPIVRGDDLDTLGAELASLANMGHRRPLDPRLLGAVRGPAVGVAGFGRCGSTMVTGMLAAGGMPTAHPWPYEPDPRSLIGRDLSGHAVKLVAAGQAAEIPYGPTSAWTFVWLDRDPIEQARSARKFLRFMAVSRVEVPPAEDRYVQEMAEQHRAYRPALLGNLRQLGEVLVLEYARILANPRRAAKDLRKLYPRLDVDAAAAVVHVRSEACAPDLATEFPGFG